MPDLFVQEEKETPKKEKHEAAQESLRNRDHKGEPKKRHSALSSYCKYPSNVRFIGADEEEVIILLLRKHFLTNIPWIFTGIVLFLAPIPFVYFPVLNFLPENFLVVAILFWYLVSMAYVLEKFLSWFFNVYIVTDERVFDVDFYNLVDRDISDANIEDIQDVTSAIRGAIRTWFDYGDILIQTSAEIPEIDFEAVPHPDQVAKILRDLRVEEDQERLEGRLR